MSRHEDVHCPECGSFVEEVSVSELPTDFECEVCGIAFEYPEELEEEFEYGDYDQLDDSN